MDQYLQYAGIGLGFFCLVLIIIENVRLNGMIKKYKKLMKGLSDKHVEDLMFAYSKELDGVKQNLENDFEKRVKALEKSMSTCLRKVGMVTYNAFDNMGNNMSFSIAALDDQSNGYIITGIYSRDHSYVYSKQIRSGQPDKELSKEERDALLKALE